MSAYPSWIELPKAKDCVRRGHDPRPAIAGTDLCGPCHGRFPRVLGDLVSQIPDVRAALIRRPSAEYKERVQSSGIADVGSLWNPASTLVLADMADWAGYLQRTIMRECPIDEGSSWGLEGLEDTRTILAVIARWHYRWLSHYPTVGPSLLHDAIEFRSACMKAQQFQGVRPAKIKGAYCQIVVEESYFGEVLCMGQLIASLDEQGVPDAVLCSNHPDHATTKPSEWIHLV